MKRFLIALMLCGGCIGKKKKVKAAEEVSKREILLDDLEDLPEPKE
jgi:hypothetical protein|tara:strand:- start:230 stop:367 length:138 start_codon:yes stop_codon:yes gene_type:complete